MLYESREAVIKLFNDYSSVVSEAKYKAIHGKGIPSMSAHVARGRVAKVSSHLNLKILSPMQMLQRLPIVLAQVKVGNTLLNEIRQIIYSLYRAKKMLKKYIAI